MNEEIYKLLWIVERTADSIYRPLIDLSTDYKYYNFIELNIDDELNRINILTNQLKQLKTMLI